LAALAVLGLLVFAAWDTHQSGQPYRWWLIGLVGLYPFAHLFGLSRRASGMTRGLFSLVYAAGCFTVVALITGPAPSSDTLLGVSISQIHIAVVAVGLLVGIVTLLALGSVRERLVVLAVGSACAAPWVIGFVNRLSPAGILRGESFYWSWPWYAQPAFFGAVLLLPAALFTGVYFGRLLKVPGGGRLFAALCLMPAILVASDAFRIDDAASSTSYGAVGEVPWTSEPGQAAEAGAGCSGVVFPERTLDEVRSGYSQSNWRARAITALEVRFPGAAWVVDQLADGSMFDVWFARGTGDWQTMVTGLSTAVHENVHIVGTQHFQLRSYSYITGREQILSIPRTSTFHRSRIRGELPASLSDLSYNDTYLEGDSGAQGLDTLLDEFNAYTWSLLTEIAFADQRPSNITTSGRDGLLAFMLYLEAYLAVAREDESATYESIVGSEQTRSVIVHLWDRAECVLALSSGIQGIGIRDREISGEVYRPERLEEIARLR